MTSKMVLKLTDSNQTLTQSSPERCNQVEELCTQCKAIDFQGIIRRTQHYKPADVPPVVELGEITLRRKSSECVLCRLLAAMIPSDIDLRGLPRSRRLRLHAFSNCGTWVGIDYPRDLMLQFRVFEMTLLAIVREDSAGTDEEHKSYWPIDDCLKESGYLCPIPTSDLGTGQHYESIFGSPDSVHFELIEKWIDHCRTNHTETCGLENQHSVPFFKVIDCESRRTVLAPDNCKYVALSYVWGTEVPQSVIDGTEGATPSIRSPTPSVIEDAITVTRKLHFRYLWVDRYCINQENEEDKLAQIYYMDDIYANAQITIIAAAGTGPTFGLPGVGNTPRKARPYARVGDYFLAATLPDPVRQVKTSKWASRAWTYQEGILSRRRLLFTEHQLLFECNRMLCAEAVDRALDTLSTGQKPGHTVMPSHSGVYPSGPIRNMLDFIADYSARQLTYESDVLHGIQGILRNFAKKSPPMHNLLGVPILPPQLLSLSYAKPLLRNSAEGFAVGLCWELIRPAKRRAGFPSWSWTGWIGEVRRHSRYYSETEGVDSGIDAWIELQDQSLMRLSEYDQLVRSNNEIPKLSNHIHLEAWTIRFTFEYLEPTAGEDEESDEEGDPPFYNQGLYAKIAVDGNCSSYSYLELMRECQQNDLLSARLRTESWEGILLGNVTEPSYGPCVLVIDSTGDHFERVGTFALSPAIHSPGSCRIHPRSTNPPSICQCWNYQNIPKARRRIRLG